MNFMNKKLYRKFCIKVMYKILCVTIKQASTMKTESHKNWSYNVFRESEKLWHKI